MEARPGQASRCPCHPESPALPSSHSSPDVFLGGTSATRGLSAHTGTGASLAVWVPAPCWAAGLEVQWWAELDHEGGSAGVPSWAHALLGWWGLWDHSPPLGHLHLPPRSDQCADQAEPVNLACLVSSCAQSCETLGHSLGISELPLLTMKHPGHPSGLSWGWDPGTMPFSRGLLVSWLPRGTLRPGGLGLGCVVQLALPT